MKLLTEDIAREILGYDICREMDSYHQGNDKIVNIGNKSEYLSEYAVDLIDTAEEERARGFLEDYYWKMFRKLEKKDNGEII